MTAESLALSRSHIDRGMAALAEGQPNSALPHFEAALEIANAEFARDPSDVDWARTRASAYEGMGAAAMQLELWPYAQAHFESALAIYEDLAGSFPDDAGIKADLSNVHALVADEAQQEGFLGKAYHHFEIALGLEQGLAAQGSALHQLRSTQLLKKLGVLAFFGGNLDAAKAHFEASVAIEERLLAQSRAFLHERAQSTLWLGHLAFERGDQAAAGALYEAASLQLDALRDDAEEGASVLQDLSICRERMGSLSADAGDREAAARHYRASLSIVEAQRQENPTDESLKVKYEAIAERLNQVLG